MPEDNKDALDIVDDFDLAFDAVVSGADLPSPTGKASESASEPEPEVTPEAEPTPEPVAKAEPEATPEPKPVPVQEPAPTPAPDFDALVAAKVEERLAAQQRKEADSKAEADALAAQQLAENFTQEEQDIIESVIREVPEMKGVIAALQRTAAAKAQNAFGAQLKEMQQQIDQRFAPIQKTVATTAQSAFDQAVLGVHSDAYDILPKVEEWVNTQPSFVKDAYNRVLDSGTAKETIELYSIFKQATQAATPKPAAPEVDPEIDKKLQQQEGVRGRQSKDTSDVLDPNDFDGAFDRFAANA